MGSGAQLVISPPVSAAYVVMMMRISFEYPTAAVASFIELLRD